MEGRSQAGASLTCVYTASQPTPLDAPTAAPELDPSLLSGCSLTPNTAVYSWKQAPGLLAPLWTLHQALQTHENTAFILLLLPKVNPWSHFVIALPSPPQASPLPHPFPPAHTWSCSAGQSARASITVCRGSGRQPQARALLLGWHQRLISQIATDISKFISYFHLWLLSLSPPPCEVKDSSSKFS